MALIPAANTFFFFLVFHDHFLTKHTYDNDTLDLIPHTDGKGGS
jgi:hypothetical protein